MNILEDYYSPSVLFHDHSYSASGVYHQIQPTYDLNVSTPPTARAACQAGQQGCHGHLGAGGEEAWPGPPAAPFHGLLQPTKRATVREGPSPRLLELGLCGERGPLASQPLPECNCSVEAGQLLQGSQSTLQLQLRRVRSQQGRAGGRSVGHHCKEGGVTGRSS